MTPERFEKARAELSHYVWSFANISTRALGLEWSAARDVPEPADLCALVETTKGGKLVVSSDHCKNTIFLHPADNTAFRAWHDALHIQNNRGFDLYHELVVARAHVQQLDMLRVSRDVQVLCEADVALQGRYFQEHGRFPDNQLDFIRKALVTS